VKGGKNIAFLLVKGGKEGRPSSNYPIIRGEKRRINVTFFCGGVLLHLHLMIIFHIPILRKGEGGEGKKPVIIFTYREKEKRMAHLEVCGHLLYLKTPGSEKKKGGGVELLSSIIFLSSRGKGTGGPSVDS